MDLMVNGTRHRVETEPQRSLLDVLRNELDLTGCKYGCGEGQCGACTVLLDGKAVRTCITPVADAVGHQIATIEGLATAAQLHPLQIAFLKCGAMQCGYCTTGMIMSATALLASKPRPSEADIRQHMNGNICRCGCYPRIAAAIQQAAGVRGGGR